MKHLRLLVVGMLALSVPIGSVANTLNFDEFGASPILDVNGKHVFGVTFGFGVGVTLGFGSGVAVGFGVADDNSISLFAVVTTGFSSAASSCSDWLDSVAVGGCFGDGDSCFSDSSAERSPAPPNHTMLSGFDDGLAATLQRISPAISATCASAIRTTFRQKGFTLLDH